MAKVLARKVVVVTGRAYVQRGATTSTRADKSPSRTGTPIKSRPVEREGSVELIGSPKAPPRAADPTHLLRLSRLSRRSWSLSESLTGDGAAIFHHACGL